MHNFIKVAIFCIITSLSLKISNAESVLGVDLNHKCQEAKSYYYISAGSIKGDGRLCLDNFPSKPKIFKLEMYLFPITNEWKTILFITQNKVANCMIKGKAIYDKLNSSKKYKSIVRDDLPQEFYFPELIKFNSKNEVYRIGISCFLGYLSISVYKHQDLIKEQFNHELYLLEQNLKSDLAKDFIDGLGQVISD